MNVFFNTKITALHLLACMFFNSQTLLCMEKKDEPLNLSLIKHHLDEIKKEFAKIPQLTKHTKHLSELHTMEKTVQICEKVYGDMLVFQELGFPFNDLATTYECIDQEVLSPQSLETIEESKDYKFKTEVLAMRKGLRALFQAKNINASDITGPLILKSVRIKNIQEFFQSIACSTNDGHCEINISKLEAKIVKAYENKRTSDKKASLSKKLEALKETHKQSLENAKLKDATIENKEKLITNLKENNARIKKFTLFGSIGISAIAMVLWLKHMHSHAPAS